MNYIGIDLAWTYKNETGICILDNTGEVLFLESKVYSDQEIVNIIDRFSESGSIISIDAPIVVKNQAGSRDAERLLMSDKIHGRNISLFVSSRKYLTKTYGTIRGEVLANEIISRNPRFKVTHSVKKEKFGIIETFPSGVCLSLFSEIYPIKYKLNRKISFKETKLEMQRMIKRLKELENEEKKIRCLAEYLNIDINELNKKEFKHLEDKVDAFLSAYCPYSIVTGKTESRVYGDDENGFIILPFSKYNSKFASERVEVKNKNPNNSNDITNINYDIQLILQNLGRLSESVSKNNGRVNEELENLLRTVIKSCEKNGIDYKRMINGQTIT